MKTAEILEKTYQCETLEELFTLINGNNLVFGHQGWGQQVKNPFLMEYKGNNREPVNTPLEGEDYYNYPSNIELSFQIYQAYVNNSWISDSNLIKLPLKMEQKLVYFGEDQNVYQTTWSFVSKDPFSPAKTYTEYAGKTQLFYPREQAIIKLEKWKKVNRITEVNLYCLQPRTTILKWYSNKNPYGYKWLTTDYLNPNRERIYKGCKGWEDIPFIVTHNELELLDKMVINDTKGLKMMDSITTICCTNSNRAAYNKMFKEGHNASQIFALPMDFVRVLWNKTDVQEWDTIRKMAQLRNCSIDDIIQCEQRFNKDEIRKMDEILRAKDINGKNVFTLTTLINYLGKIDVNEAISTYEGLPLIADVISMSRQAGEVPNFDTDSLKRTHDLTMRNLQYVKDAKTAKGVAAAYNGKYNYKNGSFLVRQIKNYDDLLDEGRQQDNCLRYCYAARIANKSSLIYVMRRSNNPDKSYISIELDPTGSHVRQQLTAHNMPITDQKALDFLKDWHDFRAEINNKEVK